MMEAIDVNYIDTEEYPSTERIKEKCVKMLADLWHAGTGAWGRGVGVIGNWIAGFGVGELGFTVLHRAFFR